MKSKWVMVSAVTQHVSAVTIVDRDCTDIHTFIRFLKERISLKLTKSYVCFNSPSTPIWTWSWKCTQRHETCQYIRDCTDRCENDTQFLTHLCDIKPVGCKEAKKWSYVSPPGVVVNEISLFLAFQNNGLLHQTPFSITATALTGSQGTAVNTCYRTEIYLRNKETQQTKIYFLRV